MTYHVGDKVVLGLPEDEEVEKEDGVIESISACPWGVSYVVRVYDGRGNDEGIRECSEEVIHESSGF